MAKTSVRLYPLALHALLLVMAILLAGLARENRELKRPRAAPEPQLAGSEASPIPVRGLDGSEATLEFTGAQQGSLLMIFTTTCPACQENQDAWRSIYAAANDRYRIVGISLEDLEATTVYHEAEELPFPVVLPVDYPRFAAEYGVTRVPLTIHIGRDGKVRDAWAGVLSETVLTQLQAFSLAAFQRF